MTRLMSFLGDRYRGKVAAYEIWNEENYAVETGGNVNVGAYPPVLKAAYQALKARDQNITVVLGGMTPTGHHRPVRRAQRGAVPAAAVHAVPRSQAVLRRAGRAPRLELQPAGQLVPR